MAYQPIPTDETGQAVGNEVVPAGAEDSGGLARRLGAVLKSGLYRLLARAEIEGAGGNVVSSTTDGGAERLDTSSAIAKWIGSTAPTVGQKAMASSIPVVISSDQSPIPVGAQGDIDNERVFSVADDINMSSSGSDNPLILLRNPGGSGKTLYILQVFGGVGVENNFAKFRLWSEPTVTAVGTAMTICKRLVGASTAPVALAYSLPTVSAEGNLCAALMNAQNQNSVVFSEAYNFAIPPGYDALITGEPKSNNRDAILTCVWVEK